MPNPVTTLWHMAASTTVGPPVRLLMGLALAVALGILFGLPVALGVFGLEVVAFRLGWLAGRYEIWDRLNTKVEAQIQQAVQFQQAQFPAQFQQYVAGLVAAGNSPDVAYWKAWQAFHQSLDAILPPAPPNSPLARW